MAAGGVVDHRDANGFRRNHAHSAKLHDAHTKIKAALARRGARGIIGLGKVFKIMDDDRSNSLSFSEFEKAMTEYKIFLTDRVRGSGGSRLCRRVSPSSSSRLTLLSVRLPAFLSPPAILQSAGEARSVRAV